MVDINDDILEEDLASQSENAALDTDVVSDEESVEDQQVEEEFIEETEVDAVKQKSSGESIIDKIKGLLALGKKDVQYEEDVVPSSPNNKKTKDGGIPQTADIETADDEEEEKQEYKGQPLMTVMMRNSFYRDGFRNLIRLAIVEAIIIVLLIIAFVSYVNVVKPEDRYFATTADGRIMKLVPLSYPNMSTSALMSWAAQSTTEVMTFGFHDYQRRLQESSRHFTRNGWEGFTNALQRSKIIESVEAASQVVTAKPTSAPILIQEGVFNGKYRWVVDLPLEITYKSEKASRVDNLMVRLVIDRVSSLENPHGVGIEQWIAKAN